MFHLKHLAPLCLSLFVCTGLASAEEAGQQQPTPAGNVDPVVARVNGEDIHLNAFKLMYERTKTSFGNAPFDQAYPKALDEMVAQRALVIDAKKAGLDRDPEILSEIERATATVIWKKHLTRKVAALINDSLISEKYIELTKATENKEEIHARHILVASEQEAVDLIKDLQKGADFTALAKEKSTDKVSGGNGGDLGFFGEGTMVPEFTAAAFALKPSAITEKPVKTQFGWHVIKLEDRRKVSPPSLDSARGQIVHELQQQKIQEVIAAVEKTIEIEKFNQDGLPLKSKK